MRVKILISLFILISGIAYSQKGSIRGHIYNKASGEPMAYATVFIQGTSYGTISDNNGFYNIALIPVGEYSLIATYIGYDTVTTTIVLKKDQVVNKNFNISETGISLQEVSISATKEQARTEVKVSSITVTPKQIKALPSTGGEPDIAQYLQIIPGVISTGDQGGQIYIRGGSPVQNRIMIDGMTVYNPFHSIGIFSVFETEVIRSADILTGGFGAEYGGRISAIVDMKTREGNKTRYSGLLSGSPFMAKGLIEGPIIKFNPVTNSSTSFLFTAKKSYIDQTSKQLYKYALDSSTGNLPFSFQDFYGKVSTIASNGSFLNVFGFNFQDEVNYTGLAHLNWKATGAGTNFKLIPANSGLVFGGNIAYSDYNINLDESQSDPRTSRIKGILSNFDFTFFGRNSETKYGIEFNAYSTDFKFTNFLKVPVEQEDNNTEIAGFFKYRLSKNKFVFDPSFRIQYYASISSVSLEPRFGFKYNISNTLRFKAAGGLYSQNLMSSVSERDIVNLFVGFLTSPDLIKGSHLISGFEYDIRSNLSLNVEGYYKKFTSLYNLNRNRRTALESAFSKESGDSYGLDFLVKNNWVNWSLWLGYSLGFVNRNDGIQTFPALFDRRHNLNLVLDYQWGRAKCWQTGLRYNMGSGFAFTKVQGFIGDNKLKNGLETNFGLDNPNIGIVYSDKINSGRLPYYNRLDLSIKRRFDFTKFMNLEVNFSVTNALDRKNIFYFNVIENRRVNQLPILPSLGMVMHF